MGLSIYDERYPYISGKVITVADGVLPVTLTGGVPATYRVDQIIVSSNAAISHDVQLAFGNYAGSFPLGSVAIPAGAGFTTVPAVDLLAVLPPGIPGGFALDVFYSWILTLAVVLGAGESMWVAVVGGYV